MICGNSNVCVDTINLYDGDIVGVGSLIFYDGPQMCIYRDFWLCNESSCLNGDDAFASGLSPSVRHVQPCWREP